MRDKTEHAYLIQVKNEQGKWKDYGWFDTENKALECMKFVSKFHKNNGGTPKIFRCIFRVTKIYEDVVRFTKHQLK